MQAHSNDKRVHPNSYTQRFFASMFGAKTRLLAIAGLGLALWAGARAESRATQTAKPAHLVRIADKPASNPSSKITRGPVVEYVSAEHAVIGWSTSIPLPTALRFGTSKDNMTQLEKSRWRRTTHQVELSKLRPETRYYFQIVLPDPSAETAIGSFTTRERGNHPERFPHGR